MHPNLTQHSYLEVIECFAMKCMILTICYAFSEAIIKFGETKFSVNEPKESGKISVVKIPVLRIGDTSKVSVVRVHTKDGSATSGEDYHPMSEGECY